MIAFPVVWFIVVKPHSVRGLHFVFCSFQLRLAATMLNYTASIRFGGWIQQFFSGNINLIPHLRAIIGRLLQEIILVRSLRSNFIDSFSFTKEHCNYAATLRKVLAPFSFSQVIDCSFFSPSRFFFSFFLDFYGNQSVTEFWINCALIRIAYNLRFQRKRNRTAGPMLIAVFITEMVILHKYVYLLLLLLLTAAPCEKLLFRLFPWLCYKTIGSCF